MEGMLIDYRSELRDPILKVELLLRETTLQSSTLTLIEALTKSSRTTISLDHISNFRLKKKQGAGATLFTTGSKAPQEDKEKESGKPYLFHCQCWNIHLDSHFLNCLDTKNHHSNHHLGHHTKD